LKKLDFPPEDIIFIRNYLRVAYRIEEPQTNYAVDFHRGNSPKSERIYRICHVSAGLSNISSPSWQTSCCVKLCQASFVTMQSVAGDGTWNCPMRQLEVYDQIPSGELEIAEEV